MSLLPAALRPYARAARAAGWTLTPKKGVWLEWRTPDGVVVLNTNRRSTVTNVRGPLRHHGITP